jgi:PAS domain S-box-containing protein
MESADAWHMTDRLHAEHGKGDPFAAAARATRMAMIITDPRQDDNPIVFANDAFLALTGYERHEVLGRNCRFLQGEHTDREDIAKVRRAIDARHDISVDLLNYRKDGTTFWNALYLSPVMNEAGELLHFFASQFDVTERKQHEFEVLAEKDRFESAVAERTRELEDALFELREALAQKTVLLHEVDHRVKNNLQMVSAMILMQSRNIPDPGVRETLDAMLARVEALSTVHRRLYQSGDVSRFDVSEFARDLVHDIVGASGRNDIELKLSLEPVEVPADKAAPIALLVNELVTNALKHAFVEGRPGRIAVAVERAAGRFRIRIEDDGVGMPGQALGANSFGMSLVETLVRQLRATMTWHPAKPSGTRIEIELPIEQPRRGE